MAESTAIEWTDATFNPWIGCTKVSPACDHCYAARQDEFRKWTPEGWGGPRRRTSAALWKHPEKWNAQPFAECSACRWRGEVREAPTQDAPGETVHLCPACGKQALREARRRVFCASLADVFDNEVPPEWRADLFRLIEKTPNLDWLLLTKRIGNASAMMFEARGGHLPLLPNVWLGATVVTQEEADRDIPKLLATPARVRFLSIEPMLGPVGLGRFLLRCCGHLVPGNDHGVYGTEPPQCCGQPEPSFDLDWVIAGGESGPKARPMHPDWARSLRDQCAAAGVPFLFKQWGEWSPDDPGESGPRERDCAGVLPSGDAALYSQGYVAPFDSSERLEANGLVRLDGRYLMSRVGKKAAGRLLDGVEHNGSPA